MNAVRRMRVSSRKEKRRSPKEVGKMRSIARGLEEERGEGGRGFAKMR